MATHPLLPSQKFLTTQNYTQLAQTIFAAPTWGSRIVFALSSKFSEHLCLLRPVVHLISFSSTLVHRASLNADGSTNVITLKKISWIAPVSGIVISSLAAYKLYVLPSSFLIKGAIAGIHSSCMLLFSYAPNSTRAFSLISLKTDLKDRILDTHKFQQLGQARLKQINDNAELTASTIFAVSNIAITCLSQNPILGNAIAYPLAAITKIATMRLLSQLALHQV
ncbi:MAG: hypothetical protein WCG10_04255 [Chlamydiota bacterium]